MRAQFKTGAYFLGISFAIIIDMGKENFSSVDEQIERGVSEVEEMLKEREPKRSLGVGKFVFHVEKISQRFKMAEDFVNQGLLNVAKASYTKLESTAMRLLEQTEDGPERKYFMDVATRARHEREKIVRNQAQKIFKEEKKYLGPILKEIDPEMVEKFEEVEEFEPMVSESKHYLWNRLKKMFLG